MLYSAWINGFYFISSCVGPQHPLLSSNIQFILENLFIWKYITLLHILKCEFYLKWGNAHSALRVLVPFILSFMLSGVCVCVCGVCVCMCLCVCICVVRGQRSRTSVFLFTLSHQELTRSARLWQVIPDIPLFLHHSTPSAYGQRLP